MHPIIRPARAAALLLAWAPLSAALAQGTRRDVGNVGEEIAKHHSWVRHLSGNTITSDAQYAADIRTQFTGGAVDVVMEQCHGGGFLNDVKRLRIPHTFASSAAWNECSLTLALPKPAAGQPAPALKTVENFSRSWRKSEDLFPTYGSLNHFRIAAGDGVVTNPANADPKGRYSPPGQVIGDKTWVEHPQYWSPDRPVNNPDGSIGGPSNTRTFTPPNGAQQYAILVQWGRLDDADATKNSAAIDIARFNKTLQSAGVNVPLRNIVVLYGETAAGTTLGPFTGIKGDGDAVGENLGTFFVDAPNTRQNWLDALAGKLFLNAAGQRGIQYGANDQLFIYNSGHGGNEDEAAPAVALGNGLRYDVALAGRFETGPAPDELAPVFTDPDGMDLLQISTRSLVTDPSLQLWINDAPFGSLFSHLLTDPSAYLDLGEFVSSPGLTYQLRVPHALLGQDPANARIELLGSGSFGSRTDLVSAFTFQGGHQAYLAVVPTAVPEPATVLLLASGALLLVLRRRRALSGPR
jgi:hypothetical protein